MPGAKACLVTATTDRFVPGTMVTVSSFLATHPRFDGDIVIVHDGLSDASREACEALSGRARLRRIGPDLRERLARLAAARPDLGARRSHFYAFEAFRLSGYRKVLFCDGDLLFRQPIDELFEAEDALLCCGDRVFLEGGCRDAATFRPLADPDQAGPDGVLERTFNDGLLLIDARLGGEAVYAGLSSLLAAGTWADTGTPHTKQFLQNRVLSGRQTLMSSTYNYLLPAASAIRTREGLAAEDAKVLHFNVPIKPWEPHAMLHWTRGDGHRAPAPAFKLWYHAWVDCLAAAHLRAAFRADLARHERAVR